MQFNNPFDELGVDALVSSELISWLDIDIAEMSVDPQYFSKVKDVMDYMKEFPTSHERQHFLHKAIKGVGLLL